MVQTISWSFVIFLLSHLSSCVGDDSVVIKLADSWPASHKHSTAEDPPCRGGRSTLNMPKLKRPLVGVKWQLGEGFLRHRHLTMVQND
ncbi:hypothetical protein TNCV_2533741 [Trichonephila clavipes]|nr:hypothetical protein TNCV_2533741 [Trichonephila clavipes]